MTPSKYKLALLSVTYPYTVVKQWLKTAWAFLKTVPRYVYLSIHEFLQYIFNMQVSDAVYGFKIEKFVKSIEDEWKWGVGILDTLVKNTLSSVRFNDVTINNNKKYTYKDVRKWLSEVLVGVKTFNSSDIFDVIGIQPMKGPVGQVYHMAISPTDPTKEADVEVSGEETVWKSMCFRIESHVVESKTRDSKVTISEDLTTDLSDAVGNLKSDEVLNDIIIQENRLEMERYLYKTILDNCKNDTIKLQYDDPRELLVHINKHSSLIARDTRRGAGNVVLVDPYTASKLLDEQIQDSGYIKHVGKLPSGEKVFTVPNFFNTDNAPILIVGYVGSQPTDCAIVYSPYTFTVKRTRTNPTTFCKEAFYQTREAMFCSAPETGKYYFRNLTIDDSNNEENVYTGT